MESLGGIDSEPTPPPPRKNSGVVAQMSRKPPHGVGSAQYFPEPPLKATLPTAASAVNSSTHHPRYGITTNSTTSNQAGAIRSEFALQSPSTHRRGVTNANNAKYPGQSSGMPSKSKSMTSPSLPRAVFSSSPPDNRPMMQTAAPRLVDATTASHAAPVVSTRHPVTAYGGAAESMYPPPPPPDHSAPYPPYTQRGLVKSNSVDIYRLSESPSHAQAQAHAHPIPAHPIPAHPIPTHPITSHTVANAFPSYGSPLPNEAVTLACSIAPPPPQYFDPRMTTSSDGKGLVYYAAAMVPAHQPTSMAYVTTSVAHPAFVVAPASVSVAAAEYGVGTLNPAEYYVTTTAPGAGHFTSGPSNMVQTAVPFGGVSFSSWGNQFGDVSDAVANRISQYSLAQFEDDVMADVAMADAGLEVISPEVTV